MTQDFSKPQYYLWLKSILIKWRPALCFSVSRLWLVLNHLTLETNKQFWIALSQCHRWRMCVQSVLTTQTSSSRLLTGLCRCVDCGLGVWCDDAMLCVSFWPLQYISPSFSVWVVDSRLFPHLAHLKQFLCHGYNYKKKKEPSRDQTKTYTIQSPLNPMLVLTACLCVVQHGFSDKNVTLKKKNWPLFTSFEREMIYHSVRDCCVAWLCVPRRHK